MLQTPIQYFVAQVDPGVVNWLLQQSPTFVIMGVIIYYLAKKLEKVENQRDDMAKDMIKLTTLYDEKVNRNDETDNKILEKIDRITNLIENGKND